MYTLTFLAHVCSASWLYGSALQPRGLTRSQHLQNYALISGTVKSQGDETKAIASQNSHFDMLSKGLFLRVFAIWRGAVSYILEEKTGRHQCYSISATRESSCWNQRKGTNYERDTNGRELAGFAHENLFFSCTVFIKVTEKL